MGGNRKKKTKEGGGAREETIGRKILFPNTLVPVPWILSLTPPLPLLIHSSLRLPLRSPQHQHNVHTEFAGEEGGSTWFDIIFRLVFPLSPFPLPRSPCQFNHPPFPALLIWGLSPTFFRAHATESLCLGR